MDRKHVVVVEDVEMQREAIAEYLTRAGFEISQADSGAALREICQQRAVDVAVVDLNLPDEDGFSLIKFLRETQRCGIIMLTANDDPTDRIVGLEVGADDYLVKPHPPRELLARIRSLLRRLAELAPAEAGPAKKVIAQLGHWRLDEQNRALRGPSDELLNLTAAEYLLLKELSQRAGAVLDREHLMQAVFHRAWQYEDRSMDVLVTRLRRKLEPTGESHRIKSVRGAGYILNLPDSH
ncbi:DNA-binding response regulator [Aureimonas endophytica]|uniref:DNA-binding response regulator n=1 Tax=Aureimonas endophytica TaxID=2027858 RepID=A0A916ZSJ0_9HYPH|nr:response regulator transcription factor [Aureimonas endophytica]GGE11807.1 DNA-binding response regulator [Aureimonas endophytica]